MQPTMAPTISTPEPLATKLIQMVRQFKRALGDSFQAAACTPLKARCAACGEPLSPTVFHQALAPTHSCASGPCCGMFHTRNLKKLDHLKMARTPCHWSLTKTAHQVYLPRHISANTPRAFPCFAHTAGAWCATRMPFQWCLLAPLCAILELWKRNLLAKTWTHLQLMLVWLEAKLLVNSVRHHK